MKKVMIPSLDMKKSVSVKVDSDLTLLLSSGVYEIKKMEPRRRLRPIVIICLFLTIAGIIGFGYFCPDQVCALSRREVITNQELITGFEHDNLGKPVQQNLLANPGLSYEEVLNDDFQFDMNAHDVMVFLHIQKTGGTSFGKHLVRDLDLKRLVNAILFFWIAQAAHGALLEDSSGRQVESDRISDDIRKQLQDVRFTLEKFNTHYLINLEQRMISMLTTMTSLDSNVKSLQEKAQVWDVFQHHIGAWNDHIKSVDQKMDLLKRAHETTPPTMETRLSNMDFKVQHVFDKVDTINEKLHDITKTVYALSSANRARRNDRESTDQGAIMTKISSLQKQLNRLESGSSNCQKKNGNGNGSSKVKKEVQEFEDEVDDFLDKLATKKLKDIAANRKHSRSLDSLTNLVRTVDERTVRIYDLEANQFEQILSCCKRTDREITTFTNSADILLKRIERLVINVDSKIEKRNLQQCEKNNSTNVEDDIAPELGSGDGAVATTTEKDYKAIEIEIDEPELTADFHQPNKQGCHQLTVRQNGVYTFGEIELNEANRDFNRRYCYFATDGPAWTVIQRRELNDLQENFNRSWTEYKNGFGDLSHEFWLGNDFIHTLTYDDNVELRIELWDFDGNSAWAEFKTFRIDSERFNYNLMVSDYHGNASDAMSYHNDQDFSTFDRANDKSNGSFACALTYGSGWWFNSCAESNLNGIYYAEAPKEHKSTGILWETWLGDYSLKESTMMIRSREVWTTDGEPQDP